MEKTRFNPFKQFTGSWIPTWLLERKELTSNAKLIYARLCQYAGQKGECYPRLETLANATGMSISSVRRSINELVEQKLIEKERRGLQKPNLYFFMIHEWNKEHIGELS